MAMVKCLVCGAVFEAGVKVCPVCGVGPEHFVPLEETSATPQGTNRRFLVLGGRHCRGICRPGHSRAGPQLLHCYAGRGVGSPLCPAHAHQRVIRLPG